MLKLPVIFLLVISLPVSLAAQGSKQIRLNDSISLEADMIYKEDFNKDLNDWVVEQQPGGKVFQKNGKMEIEDVSGCTVWLRIELSQPVMIEYTANVIDKGGPHDRVSDLNCFWLATDLWHDGFFEDPDRKGKFNQYDSLRLYYVGLGGHHNTKTRFRRYLGNGKKPLLNKHDLSDSKFLISGNVQNFIRIIVWHGIVQYWRNGQLIYNYYDDTPYQSGYFAIRTVNNHMTIDDFRIYDLKRKLE